MLATHVKRGWVRAVGVVGVILAVGSSSRVAAEDLVLTATPEQARLATDLGQLLERSGRFKIMVQTAPLPAFARRVVKAETDLFVVSADEWVLASKMERDIGESGRAITAVVAEKVHLVTLRENGMVKIGDLGKGFKPQKVSLGPLHSASELHAREAIDAYGGMVGDSSFKCRDRGGVIECQNDALLEQPRKLLRGDIGAYFVTGDPPVGTVLQVAESGRLQLIEISEKVVKTMNQRGVVAQYVATTIDRETYEKGTRGAVSTAGIVAAVGVTRRVDGEGVRAVAEYLLEKKPFLGEDAMSVAVRYVGSFMTFRPEVLPLLRSRGMVVK